MNGEHKVTIIIPCRNESGYIAKVLNNIILQDYDKSLMEVLVIDGKSDDNTLDIITEYAKKYSFIKVHTNEEKVVPTALNIGIKAATGSVIIRMDAHSEYPLNYVSRLVYYLFELKAENVGGRWETLPSGTSNIAQGIAICTSHPFGIGNAKYRLESNAISEVDTVPFGCFKRELFDRIGGFDVDLIRNQDDEFNARIIRNGGKIFLIPDIIINYFARGKLNKMIKMFYQYSFYKPLVNKKIKSPATIRQFFPLLFLLNILAIPIELLIFKAVYFTLIPILAYFCLLFYFTVRETFKRRNINLFYCMPLIFLLIHLSYGTGYLFGIFYFIILGRERKTVALSR